MRLTGIAAVGTRTNRGNLAKCLNHDANARNSRAWYAYQPREFSKMFEDANDRNIAVLGTRTIRSNLAKCLNHDANDRNFPRLVRVPTTAI